MSNKPNFLVIGAPKAATTNLCHALGTHPDVYMSTPKEPRFFSDDHVYARGWDWYLSLFDGAASCRAIGEGSTSYSLTGIYPKTGARIEKDLPDVKIIYTVRNPIERVESGWMQLRNAAAPYACRDFNKFLRERPNAVEGSCYWKQISAYRRFVPDERILLLFFDDYITNSTRELARCFEFLCVDHAFEVAADSMPRNAHTDLYQDRRVTEWLRRIPGAETIRRRTPTGLRSGLLTAFRQRFATRPRWESDTRRWFVDQVADDVHQFLKYGGKPEDYWSMED
ncbi:MAG: sulfotransferase domain-containing protein [Planctomycetota bacterium]|jgi:hypothetical protein